MRHRLPAGWMSLSLAAAVASLVLPPMARAFAAEPTQQPEAGSNDVLIKGRYNTFEDLYRESGVNFQGAVGYRVAEGTSTRRPVKGYGIGLDDMVLEWKEIRVDEDTTTNCATSGACATLDVQANWMYESLARVPITVTDRSPGSPANGNNDCDHNGVYADAADSPDCDGNGARDVWVHAWDYAEPAGEWVLLNETAPLSGVFKGELPVSSVYDSPGTLFVQRWGALQPEVSMQYDDPDDGTGKPCQPDPNPSHWGFIQAFVIVTVPVGNVVIKGSRIVGVNGDGDTIADTNETVDMYVTVSNGTGKDVTHLVARLASNSPYVDCIINPLIALPLLPKDTSMEVPVAFRWKVSASAARTSTSQEMSAEFNVTISADPFDVSQAAQTVVQDLDLDISGGGATTSYNESFEGGGLGTFTSMQLDNYTAADQRTSQLLADGTRCQYNDPDFVNSNSYGETYCYPGFSFGVVIPFDWHVHTTSSNDGGRAYVGSQSLHWGFHKAAGNPDNDTTHFSALQAVRMTNPVNLAYATAPQLTFKHQASFVDYRYIGTSYMTAPDRGVVEIQLADEAGMPAGFWKKLKPYENVYDIQAQNQYINCSFDPIDDGNDEDSFFNPTDPYRWYGPSSTCFPEFNFGYIGDTDWRNPYMAGNVGRASDDKTGKMGSINRGTWVESRFDLGRFKGRRARVRFLATTIKVYEYSDPLAIGFQNGVPIDDGWYIDDIEISPTLDSPATIAVDATDNSGLPTCPANCTSVTASLTATPSPSPAPGHIVDLDASGSRADACIGGTLQFQWHVNGARVKDWTDNAFHVDAPEVDSSYQVHVRCSSAQSCTGGASVSVTVACPNLGANVWTGPLTVTKTGGLAPAEPDFDATLGWNGGGPAQWTDVVRGDLILLRNNRTFNGTAKGCVFFNGSASATTDGFTLSTGGGFYFLARGAYCNVAPSHYRYGDAKETFFCSNTGLRCASTADCGVGTCTVTKDPELDAEASACP